MSSDIFLICCNIQLFSVFCGQKKERNFLIGRLNLLPESKKHFLRML